MKVEFFESVEEMFEVEREAREAADARVQEWQKQIKVGDCFRQSTPYGFDIYGEVLKGYKRAELRNYRFCYCFSVACPEGEKGDVHVSAITCKTDEAVFSALYQKMNNGKKPVI